MASRYWVGGTATWDGTAGTKWATTSGGAGGAAIPTSADDVFFDSASGAVTVTLSSSSVARSIDCNGFTGTISHPAALTVSIGDGTAGAGNRALRFASGMTYTRGASTSALSFVSTSATVQTITTAGKTLGNVTFNGVAGSWQLADANTVGATATVTLTNGTLDTNGQTCSWGSFASSNSNTRTLTLGASNISLTVTGAATPWNITTSTNMTLNAGTSTLSFATSGQGPTFQGGGLTYYNLSITSTSGGFTLQGANTFTNLTFSQGAGNRSFNLGTGLTQTITGLLTLTGFDANQNRLRMQSNTIGTQCTFALGATGTVSLSNVDFTDIAFTGTNAPVSGTSLGDGGGNSGITFTPAVTRYWVGGTGNMSDSTKWSATSGGAGGASVPIIHDTLIFDSNSFTTPGQTVSQNIWRVGNVDFSAVTNNPTLAFLDTNGAGFAVFGNLTFASGMTMNATSAVGSDVQIILQGRGSQTLTNAGQIYGSGIFFTVIAPNGTYTLQDNLNQSDATRTFSLNTGTFNANGYNVTCGLFNSSNSNTRTLTMGSGTWTLTGTGNVWNFTTTTGLTYNVGTSTVVISDTSASSKTIISPSSPVAFYNLTINSGGSGAVIWSGTASRSINTLTITGPKTIQWAASGTYVVTTWNVQGLSGDNVVFNSTTPGTRYTFSNASGLVQVRYVTLQDSLATGGATFVALNSTNAGNNVGWDFRSSRDIVTTRLSASGRGVATGRISVSMRPQMLFSPSTFANLALWLRADSGITLNGSTVSSWVDKSGNGYSFTQSTAASQPTYNGSSSRFNNQPTISSDGGDVLASTNCNITGAKTIYTVYRFTTIPSAGNTATILSVSDSAETLFSELIVLNSVGGYETLSFKHDYQAVANGVGHALTLDTNPLVIENTWNGSTNTTPGNYTSKISGYTQTVVASGAFARVVGELSSVFGRATSGGAPGISLAQAEIAEIIVYSRVLTDTEKAHVRVYLAERYALPVSYAV